MNKAVMIAAALSLSMTGAANACAPAPSCWISEGTSYLRGICRNYAKANRTVAEIKEFLDEPEKIADLVVACKKEGVTFKTGEATPSKKTEAVVCVGDQAGAHTLVIGNCSFEGELASKVVETCKNEEDYCLVQAHGWNNGHGILIITSVESIKLVDAKTAPLSTQELDTAKNCKAGKACSLTCNRVHDAGRDDLIKAGACAE